MDEIERHLNTIKGRWMTGAPGAEAAPAEWKPLLGTGTEAELRLLALAGQALQVVFEPDPGEDLTPAPPLPALALPTMPEGARGRFCRLLAGGKHPAAHLNPVLELIEARGFAVHPVDWMPKANDADAPALYAPWVDWLNGGGGAAAEETPSAETWPEWSPAERRGAIAALRRRDPAAARDLLEARIGDAPAEERLRLLALLEDGLGADDLPFLSGLEKDRSGKVRALALQLRARLGDAQVDGTLVVELAETLDYGRKGFSLSKTLGPRKLQNNAQKQRRLALFDQVPLDALAQAVGLTPAQAVAAWQVKGTPDIQAAFARMVAMTGAGALPRQLAERLLGAGHVVAVGVLLPRLSPQDRAALVPAALSVEGGSFGLALDLLRPGCGTLPLDALTRAVDFAGLRAAIETSVQATDKTDWRAENTVAEGLRALGLLGDAPAARALLTRFTDMGLIPADPRLDTLHLNAALNRSET